MHFDALCLACMVDELNATLCPGRVQQVVATGARSVGLEVYSHGARHALLLDAAFDYPLVYVSAGKLRRGEGPDTPLLLLLRKYVRDAGLVAVRQPIAYERVLELTFANTEHGPTVLVVELIGRSANLILRRANGVILDCLTRVPPAAQRTRTIMPGRAYAPPPSQAKLPPLDDGAADTYARLAAITQAEGPLWKALVATVAGVSPAQAREMAWRAAGAADAPAHAASLPALVEALQALWLPTRTHAWNPGCLLTGDGRAVAYAPYVIHEAQGQWQPQPTLSAAIAAVVDARSAQADARSAQADARGAQADAQPQRSQVAAAHDDYADARAAAEALLRTARKRIHGQLGALAADEPAPGAAEALRTQATWLLALQSRIQPGAQVLTVGSDETGDAEISIALDSARTPVQQAEAFFKRAGKLERAAIFVPTRRAHLQNDLAYLEQLEADLAQAQSRPEIAAVGQAIYTAGLLPAPKEGKATRPAQPAGPRRYESGGCTILVGRNAQQNDKLTFTLAKPDDYWLHVRGGPGSHVLVHCPQGEPDAAVLEAAAQLAAYFSTRRAEGAADVIVTQRRHLARPHEGRPGQVHVRQERVLHVRAQAPAGLTDSS